MPRLGIYDYERGLWHAREGTKERLESDDVNLILDTYLDLKAHGVQGIEIVRLDEDE